jgi:site-specific DNA-methyltransferase (adenine-specific)
MKLINGDCLEEMKNIESGSVDLIVCDLPYGTVGESMKDNTGKYKIINESKWDNVIDTKSIMIEADRVLRRNGKMCLFAQQPFTTKLINGAIPNLPYSYTVFWEKLHFANCLSAKKACVNYIEEVLIFSKKSPKHDENGLHPLRNYFMAELLETDYNKSNIRDLLGNQMGSHYFTNGAQFCLPTLRNYEKLQLTGYFNRPYGELKAIDLEYRADLMEKMNEKFPSTFNLWEGKKFKSNIFKYKKDYDGHHPTQKPVLLLEDLIRTFSDENNLVVDMTMGSGSTGVACKNLSRDFIGIELDKTYFDIAEARINENN